MFGFREKNNLWWHNFSLGSTVVICLFFRELYKELYQKQREEAELAKQVNNVYVLKWLTNMEKLT